MYINFSFQKQTTKTGMMKILPNWHSCKLHTNYDGVRATAIYWGPSPLAHHGDLRSSQWSKPQKLHRPPFEWTTKRLLWYPFRCYEWRAGSVTAAEFTALSSWVIFMFLWIRLSFIHKTHALGTLFCNCHVKILVCFYEPQVGRISLNISLSVFVLRLKNLRQKH